MLFNSIEFAFFLPIIFLLYWHVVKNNITYQNILLVTASYIFYGWWDWRFLLLIAFSAAIDYTIGLQLDKSTSTSRRKILLSISIFTNLGLLGFFKYYNFFAESFVDAFTLLGQPIRINSLQIILPIGISFYTFQTLSYTIDIYRKKLNATNDIIAFFAFVSFFPQLVAGPIERATNLLPQFFKKRTFDYSKATDGLRQILWGLFKKMVIADNCAEFVNEAFTDPASMDSSSLILCAILFSFQIYGDFSGYSDIAIGTARLFGFELKQNFKFPYFSQNVREFWQRWHISLNTWFIDYIYKPLGGSRSGVTKTIRNMLVVFLLSGLWHGANWTFIVWAILNALYFTPYIVLPSKLNTDNNSQTTVRTFINTISTFSLITISWIFFRAESIQHAFSYISSIITNDIISNNNIVTIKTLLLIVLIIIMMRIEWLNKNYEHGLYFNKQISPRFRYLTYTVLVSLILWFKGNEQSFMYFQF